MNKNLCKICHTNPVHENLTVYHLCADCWNGMEPQADKVMSEMQKVGARARAELDRMNDAENRYLRQR